MEGARGKVVFEEENDFRDSRSHASDCAWCVDSSCLIRVVRQPKAMVRMSEPRKSHKKWWMGAASNWERRYAKIVM
jgi:hypothetical protein